MARAREEHTFRGSTRCARAWYDESKQLLLVQFVDGTMWTYRRVKSSTWRSFISAESPGRFVTNVLDAFANSAR